MKKKIIETAIALIVMSSSAYAFTPPVGSSFNAVRSTAMVQESPVTLVGMGLSHGGRRGHCGCTTTNRGQNGGINVLGGGLNVNLGGIGLNAPVTAPVTAPVGANLPVTLPGNILSNIPVLPNTQLQGLLGGLTSNLGLGLGSNLRTGRR